MRADCLIPTHKAAPWLATADQASPLTRTYARLDSSDLTSEPEQHPCIYCDSSVSPETLGPEISPVPVPGSSDVTFSIHQYTSLATQAGPSRYVWTGRKGLHCAHPGHSGLTSQPQPHVLVPSCHS